MLHNKPLFLYAPDEKQSEGAEAEEVDVDQLSQEELERATVDENDRVVLTPDPGTKEDQQDDDEEPADDKKDPPKDEKKAEEKAEEPFDELPDSAKTDSQIKELEDIPKEERTPEQTLELRRLHAERRMHQAIQKSAELERKLEEIEKKKPDEDEIGKFEYLEEDEEDALMQEDPAEYRKYLKEKEAYESKVAERQMSARKETFHNIGRLYQEVTGTNGKVEDAIQTPEFKEWLKSDEFKALDRFVTGNMKPVNGTYSMEQLQAAHRAMNYEKAVSQAELRGRQEAVDDIKGASRKGSELDKAPKESGPKGTKSLDSLTPEEIESMSAEELASWEKELQRQGMA